MARAEDTRRYKARHPDKVAQFAYTHKVKQRALVLLAKIYPDDLKALMSAVRADMEAEGE